jgi:hypothetical protein
VNTLAPFAVEQIMRDHLDRADSYRRAAAVRVGGQRRVRQPRMRRVVGAFVARLAA